MKSCEYVCVCAQNQQMSSNKEVLWEIFCTHNFSFTQKPFEVVFLDVHQGGDVRDIEAVVLHMVGL